MDSLISIAMCSYNGERFIKDQIDSIVSQTYKNFELIIVDDGSKDNTIEIIKDYQSKDNRIKLFQNEKNLGFVKNFEKAITLCSGDFIALADQDDVWKRNKLEVFLNNIDNNMLIYSDAILIDQYSKETGQELIRPDGNLVDGKCNKAFIFYNCVSGNTLMFRKELVKDIIPIPNDITFHDIWIAFLASTKGTITFTDEPMTYYRRYSEQITRNVSKDYKSISDRLKKKQNSYLLHAQNLVNYCSAFRKVDGLDDDIKNILNILIDHYSNYKKGYFNFKMQSCLKKYKDELFAIKRGKTRNRYITRYSSKNKLLKIFFYSI
ncbi:glycosyltransferase, family 2 [Aliarcobacter cibarius]|uniref:glycosyltransferase family 2 protein n=1 Tax=Aliarcobacter cibarius TaxID=255507 RepID=UPI001246CB3F|nr:glycosyltransferase family 2 protein [Aliarcobacter cibarius]QEZ88615.1 glycosyltransferase, family 2 [Aliarcobacter cibarius]